MKLLERWHGKRAGSTTTQVPPGHQRNAELAVDNRVRQEKLRQDQGSRRSVSGLIDKLNDAAHRNTLAWQHLEQLKDEHRVRIRQMRRTYETVADADGARRGSAVEPGLAHYDPWWQVIPPWALTALETAFVVVEFYFWSTMLNQSVPYAAPLFAAARLPGYLVAALIPLVGVITARLAGYLGHRWIMNYPGISRRRHWGVVVAGAALVVMLIAVWWLVDFRFTAAVTFAKTKPPAAPLAIVFCLALLADALVRVFLTSEIKKQERVLTKDFERRRRRVITTNTVHTAAWHRLNIAVAWQSSLFGRLDTVGTGLLAESAAWFGDPDSTVPLPEFGAALGQIGTPNRTLGEDDSFSIPIAGLKYEQNTSIPSIAQFSVLAAAGSCLRQAPPRSDPWVERRLAEIRSELFDSLPLTTPTTDDEPNHGGGNMSNGQTGHRPGSASLEVQS